MKPIRLYLVVCILRWIWLIYLLSGPSLAGASVYYLATNGNDANTGSNASPWKSFSKAWGVLGPGDTLWVGNGTFASVSPPPGKSGAPGNSISVQAQTDGGAILDGGVELRNNTYLEFSGFKIISTGASLDAHSDGAGLVTHHITFRRCGFNTTTTGEDGGIGIYDGTHHLLLEDFWAWGGGRYTLCCYGGPGGSPPNLTCDYNTFRRGVIRQGPAYSSGGNPEAALALYYANNNLVENVIALDGNQDSDSSNAAFYLTSHAPPPEVSGNKFFGVLALNNLGVGWYLDHNGTGSANEVYDSVFWKSSEGGIAFYSGGVGGCSGNLVDHVTVGENSGAEGFWNYCDDTAAKSSIFIHNGTFGMKQGGMGGMGAHNWNLLYNNVSGAYSNMAPGANDQTVNPDLLYIGRTETGSPCKGGGEAGGDCGADLTRRYQDGVKTGSLLWPWPYQDRIKKDMCTDANVTTGFCAQSTLTEYVWGYLGNPNPYPGSGGNLPPANPRGIKIRP